MQQEELILITSMFSVPHLEILPVPRFPHTVVERHMATQSLANSSGRHGLTPKVISAASQAVHCSDRQRMSPLILRNVSGAGGEVALSTDTAYVTASGPWAEPIPTHRAIPAHVFRTIPSGPAMAYLISSSSPHATRALASSIPPAGPMPLFCKLSKET